MLDEVGAEADAPTSAEVALDKTRLRAVAERLVEVYFEMLDAGQQADIEAMQTGTDLRWSYRVLAQLASRYGVYLPKDWDATVPTEDVLEDLGNLSLVQWHEFGPLKTAKSLLECWFSDAIEYRPLISIGHDFVKGVGSMAISLALEGLVLFVSGGLALIVAFRGLYSEKPFGAGSDYFAVLLLGVGAELIISGLFKALEQWRAPAPPIPEVKAA